MSSLCDTLRADLRTLTAGGDGTLTLLSCLVSRPGFLAVFLYRIAARCAAKGIIGKFSASLISRVNVALNGCDISSKAVIGPGFKMSHPMGIVIGPAIIGRNAMIMQNVSLGMRRFTDDELDPASYPRLGDNVIVCAGAVLGGGIAIGDGAIIGANSVVLIDVPAGSTAVGIPARIIQPKISTAVP